LQVPDDAGALELMSSIVCGFVALKTAQCALQSRAPDDDGAIEPMSSIACGFVA
jgi:hypothetical protein